MQLLWSRKGARRRHYRRRARRRQHYLPPPPRRLEDTIEGLKMAAVERATDQATLSVATTEPIFKQDANAYFFDCIHRARQELDDFKLAVRRLLHIFFRATWLRATRCAAQTILTLSFLFSSRRKRARTTLTTTTCPRALLTR